MKTRVGKSKWVKWLCLSKSQEIQSHLPDTAIYSLEKLQQFSAKYNLVFVKPDGMSLGKNVMTISRDGYHWVVRKGKIIKRFSDLSHFDKWFRTFQGNHRYLVQQGIPLAKYNGRPVDMRSVIIKNENGNWEVTATVAKRAGKGLMITNVAAGGHILTIQQYLDGLGYSKTAQKRFFQRFHKLSILVGKQLEKCYSNYIYGLDIGIDDHGKLWIIEANTKPNNSFLPSYNRQMYLRTQQLLKYHKHA